MYLRSEKNVFFSLQTSATNRHFPNVLPFHLFMVQSFGVTQSFLNAWKYISNTGVKPEFDDNTIKKIVLSNQISIAMLVLVTLSTIIFGYDNGFSGLALVIGAINIVPIATIALNALGFVGASRVVLGTLTPFVVLVNIV